MPKPVKLSLHKNTRAKRNRKETADYLTRAARKIAGMSDLKGFVLVGWSDDFSSTCAIDQGDSMPDELVGEYIKQRVARHLNRVDTEEFVFSYFNGPEGA